MIQFSARGAYFFLVPQGRFRFFQIFYYYALFTTLITLTVLKKLHHLKKEKNITDTSPK